MNYKTILRLNPWLKLVNLYNISFRFLEATNNDILVVYNALQDRYEMHSVRSFQLSASSINAVIDKDFINGFILYDYKANELRRFVTDIQSERQHLEKLYDAHEEKRFTLDSQFKSIERTLGTKI